MIFLGCQSLADTQELFLGNYCRTAIFNSDDLVSRFVLMAISFVVTAFCGSTGIEICATVFLITQNLMKGIFVEIIASTGLIAKFI